MALFAATLSEIETPEEIFIKYYMQDFPVTVIEIIDSAATFIANHWRKKGHAAKSMFKTKPWRNRKKEKEKKFMQVPDGKGGTLTVEMTD